MYATYLNPLFCQNLNFSFKLSENGGKNIAPKISEIKPAIKFASKIETKPESINETPKMYLNTFIRLYKLKLNFIFI